MSNKNTLTIKDFPYIDEKGIHFASELWRTSFHMEENTMPSMVEKCYNPSISEILANPSLAAHQLNGNYDDGDSMESPESDWENDIQNFYNLRGSEGDEPTLGKSDANPKPASGAERSPQAQDEQDSEIGSSAGEHEGSQSPSSEVE